MENKLTPLVTSCAENYLPGLKALYNSYLRNSQEGFSFHAMIDGTQELADHVQNDLGIDVLPNPKLPDANYPTSKHYPVFIEAMWRPMMVPSMFPEHEKSIYIDTDQLILQNLQPLVDVDQGDRVLAATRCNGNVSTCYRPTTPSEGARFGPMTSFMIYNNEPWLRKRIVEGMVEAMKIEGITWTMIGQGLLHYVIGRDWTLLPWSNHAHAGHATYFAAPKHEVFTLHFMGTKPWNKMKPEFVTENKLKTRALWQTYA
jgi:lipopolysaccharide biosynthesis glycosyltransferase